MQTYKLTLELDSYVASPYWPETNSLVDIQKKSGLNRARTPDKREAALRNYLKAKGMTIEDYQALEQKSKRAWYRVDNDSDSSEIVVPAHQFRAALVHAAKTAPAGAKIDPENLRSVVRCSEPRTGCTKASGRYERYVRSEDSNQRRFTTNEYLGQHPEQSIKGERSITCTGKVKFDNTAIKKETVEKLISHALANCGIGTTRKMGCGRGRLISLEIN